MDYDTATLIINGIIEINILPRQCQGNPNIKAFLPSFL